MHCIVITIKRRLGTYVLMLLESPSNHKKRIWFWSVFQRTHKNDPSSQTMVLSPKAPSKWWSRESMWITRGLIQTTKMTILVWWCPCSDYFISYWMLVNLNLCSLIIHVLDFFTSLDTYDQLQDLYQTRSTIKTLFSSLLFDIRHFLWT